MMRLGTIAVCLAGGLALSASARAGGVMLAGNPYEPIMVRNVFGLNPPSTNTTTGTEDAQLPKITLVGITDILGQLQALFKVSPKPGQKDAKEMSYILSEGQAQDEIEVVRIDDKSTLVTFNNHGTVQEIPLANAPKINAPAIVGGGGGAGGGNAGGAIPPRFGGLRGIGGGQNRGVGGGPALSSVPTQTRGGAAATQGSMSAEEQAVLMEVQREEWRQQGKPHNIIPPTGLTPQLQSGEGGP